MHHKADIKIHNRFDIHVIREGKVIQEAVAENIILDGMYYRLCNGYDFFDYIHFGTGAGTPTVERTTLFSPLGYKVSAVESYDLAVPVSSITKKIQIMPEEYIGETLTEVGISNATSTVLTHAMIKDSEGQPLSINKTAIDVIEIYATFYVTFTLSDGLELSKLENNLLLKYLLPRNNSQTLSSTAIYAGTCGIGVGTGVIGSVEKYLGVEAAYIASNSWVGDEPNKKRTISTRLDINTANGLTIEELIVHSTARFPLPASVQFAGHSVTDKAVGVGDGVTTKFLLPNPNVQQNTVVVKLNDVTTTAYSKGTVLHKLGTRIGHVTHPVGSSNYGRGHMVYIPAHDELIACSGLESNTWSTKFDIYKYANGIPIHHKEIVHSMTTNAEKWIDVSDDGNVACIKTAGTNSQTCLLVRRNGEWEIEHADFQQAYGMALSGDGKKIFTYYLEVDVRSYDYATGVLSDPVTAFDPGTVYVIRANYDGTKVAVLTSGGDYISMYELVDTVWTKRTFDSIPYRFNYIDYQSLWVTDDFTLMAACPEADQAEQIVIYKRVGDTYVRQANPTGSLAPVSAESVFMNTDGSKLYLAYPGTYPYIEVFNGVDGVYTYSHRYEKDPLGVEEFSIYETEGMALISEQSGDGENALAYYDMTPIHTEITFDTPPAVDTVITADYTLDGIDKTTDWVVDFSLELQFGQG